MHLGACELHRTWETFFQQPLVKGLTPPRNFPVTCRKTRADTKEEQKHLTRSINMREGPERSTNVSQIKMIQDSPTVFSGIEEFLTCSLVVLPLATSTMWKPVRPATGMKNRPATHITASLGAQGSRKILNTYITILQISQKDALSRYL